MNTQGTEIMGFMNPDQIIGLNAAFSKCDATLSLKSSEFKESIDALSAEIRDILYWDPKWRVPDNFSRETFDAQLQAAVDIARSLDGGKDGNQTAYVYNTFRILFNDADVAMPEHMKPEFNQVLEIIRTCLNDACASMPQEKPIADLDSPAEPAFA